jgi:DNA-binding transcriptional regulator YiaG
MDASTIRTLRQSLDLTQREFARLLHLSGPSHIAHLEAGRKAPVGPLLALLQLLARRPELREILEENAEKTTP